MNGGPVVAEQRGVARLVSAHRAAHDVLAAGKVSSAGQALSQLESAWSACAGCWARDDLPSLRLAREVLDRVGA